MKRESEIERKTKETWLKVYLDVDGTGKGKIDTGITLLDHFLEQVNFHLCP